MSLDNKAVTRRIVDEVWGKGNASVVDELFAEDYVDRSPGLPPDLPRGREGISQLLSTFNTAFPKREVRAEDEIEQGDKVIVRWSFRGTQQGEFMGIPATGKEATFGGITIYRMRDGKVVEEWTQADMMGLMQQLGAIPEMAQA